ncbi:N-acetylmuramoyl-L-alanine amidase [Bacillus sp. RG28]|uniref:N-acetylmuramoyl-L-alanine amidase n=1 Tax=Gottfriedia endophytica TaxID=2820819 RepID=A0A940NQW8_9BACI|nr:N-acetylmuramoyl-L-alanine amidase [Gottfriedia endophytica]MBP0727206.1 N-acetylmuramoyl-L-alanine amidase [Gottfriedia endophytica]
MNNKSIQGMIKLASVVTIASSSLLLSPKHSLNAVSAATISQTGQVTATSLNVRSGPSTSYKTIIALKKGSNVTIIEKQNGWYKIKSGQTTGWVRDTYIKLISTTNTTTNPKPSLPVTTNQTGQITAASLNVRTGPSTSYKSIASLKSGSQVKILEKKNDWYKISYGKISGWVSGKYVKIIVSPAKPTPPSNNGGTTVTPNPTPKYGEVTGSALNMRKGPGTTFDVISSLNIGTRVTIKSEQNGWYQVTSGSLVGWVSGKYIKSVGSLTPSVDHSLEKFTLVLDAGHGGKDTGADGSTSKGATIYEKNITLRIVEYAKGYLSKLPIKIYFTRESDVYPSLGDRVAFAKSKNASAFISVHLNASDGTGNGTETYYYNGKISSQSPTKLQDSKLLAECIQKREVSKLNLKDRGVKSADYYVIKNNPMAAILTEVGFVDNKTDNAKLNDPYWQEQAGKQIYLGVLDYLKFQGYDVNSYYIN